MSVRTASLLCVAVTATLAATAGCSSGSGASHATTSTNASAAGSPAVAAAAPAAPSNSGIDPLATRGCAAIPAAQASLLLAAPVSSVTVSEPTVGYYADHHFVCDAGLQITVYPNDGTKTQYTTDLAAENATATTLPGIADVAVFTQSGPQVSGAGPMPDVYVHSGAATCEIKTSSTITDYNIKDISTGFSDGVTVAAATAWSTKAAGLCTDAIGALTS